MRNKRGTIGTGLAAVFTFALGLASWPETSAAETIVFTDGSRLNVAGLEIRGNLVIWRTPEGKLRSVTRDQVDWSETRRSRENEDRTDEALELLGFRILSNRIASSAREAAAAHRRVSDPSDVGSRVLLAAFARGFDPERFYEVATGTFRARVAAEDLEPSISWLRTPLARRIDRLEKTGPRPAGEPFDSFLVSLDQDPPSRARLELIERIDQASRTSEAAVEMQGAMLRALLDGVNRSRPLDRRLSSGELEAAVVSMKTELRGRAHSRIRLALLYTYREANDEDLASYLRYLESPSGRWLGDVVFACVVAAMEDAAERSGDVIAESLLDLMKTKA